MEIIKKIEDNIHIFLISIKKQAANTKEAGEIIEKYFLEGKLTSDEEKILKIQIVDSLKIVGVIIPFVLIPGASILMPLILKVAEKNNIDLLPSAFKDNKIDESKNKFKFKFWRNKK